jgi:presenilin-like A22 family membrane protease
LAKIKKVYLPETSLQDFLTTFLIATIFVLLFISYKKAGKFKDIIYKAFFLIACFWGGMTILNLFLPIFVALVVMAILIFFWLEKPNILVHNTLIILGLSGVASFLGLGFSSAVVVLLLLIFSVYDFIAVYKTKHMVELAKEMVEKKVILGFIIPKNIYGLLISLKEVNLKTGKFIIIGGGDVVFPSLLAVSIVPHSIVSSIIVALFSCMGLFFSYYLFFKQEETEPIPALPPIAFFTIIGYLLTLFL